jgi:hypothetical protein
VLVTAGLLTGESIIAVALAPTVLFLAAIMFQQFADVSVLGAGRATLEEQLAARLGARALIYEHAVAPVRKRPPLVRSIRALQLAIGALILPLLAAGTYVALEGQRSWPVPVAYFTITTVAALVAAMSYRDMLRAGPVAREQFGRSIAGGSWAAAGHGETSPASRAGEPPG